MSLPQTHWGAVKLMRENCWGGGGHKKHQMPSYALRELLKCWLPGGDEEISGKPSPWALCMSAEEKDGYENAGGRPKKGKNMLFFRLYHLYHLVGHLSVCRFFCTPDRGQISQVWSKLDWWILSAGEEINETQQCSTLSWLSSYSIFSPLYCFYNYIKSKSSKTLLSFKC